MSIGRGARVIAPAAIAILATVLAACGGEGGEAAGQAPAAAVRSGGSSQPLGANPAGKDTAATPGATVATPPTEPASAGSTVAIVRLDRGCVRRGGDLQGLTVHIDPGALVAYSTEYSDGSSELTDRSYATGFGYGPAGPDGVYRATWVVPSDAPPGRATVHLTATEPIQTTATFQVETERGRCP